MNGKVSNTEDSLVQAFEMIWKEITELRKRIGVLEGNPIPTSIPKPKAVTKPEIPQPPQGRKWEQPVNGVQIPQNPSYLLYENQAIKGPNGFFLKPMLRDGIKWVQIEGDWVNVNQLHAQLHLIPGVKGNPDWSDEKKEESVWNICAKWGLNPEDHWG